MATLTTANLLTRIANQLRVPESNTTETTKLLAVGNMVYREIASKADWYWLHKRQLLNTVAPVTTGTASVAKGSTTVTISTTLTPTVLDKTFHVPSNAVESGLYRVSAHTDATDSITLASAYTGEDDTAATYKLWTDEYDLDAGVAEVRDIRRFGWPEPMARLGLSEMQSLKAYDRSEGPPQAWAVYDFDTTGDSTTTRQLVIHPFPDDTYQMEMIVKQGLATELSGSTRPAIPDDYLHVWEWGWLSIAYPIFLSDHQRGQLFAAKYVDALNLMVSQHRAHQGNPQIVPADAYRGFYRRGRRVSAATADLGSYFDRWPVNP